MDSRANDQTRTMVLSGGKNPPRAASAKVNSTQSAASRSARGAWARESPCAPRPAVGATTGGDYFSDIRVPGILVQLRQCPLGMATKAPSSFLRNGASDGVGPNLHEWPPDFGTFDSGAARLARSSPSHAISVSSIFTWFSPCCSMDERAHPRIPWASVADSPSPRKASAAFRHTSAAAWSSATASSQVRGHGSNGANQPNSHQKRSSMRRGPLEEQPLSEPTRVPHAAAEPRQPVVHAGA